MEKRLKSQEEVAAEMLLLLDNIEDSVHTIKGWIIFMGVIVLLAQLFGLLASCGVL